MLGAALYYPYIENEQWLKAAVLFWGKIQTIVPASVMSPYQKEDTKICEQEGYLRPLRCDLRQDTSHSIDAGNLNGRE